MVVKRQVLCGVNCWIMIRCTSTVVLHTFSTPNHLVVYHCSIGLCLDRKAYLRHIMTEKLYDNTHVFLLLHGRLMTGEILWCR